MEVKYNSPNYKSIFREKKPLYLCHGEYEFLQSEFIQELLDNLLTPEEKTSSVVKLDCDKTKFSKILEFANTTSMFSDKQVIIVENANLLKLTKRVDDDSSANKKTSKKLLSGKEKAVNEKYENMFELEKFRKYLESPCPSTYLVMLSSEHLDISPTVTSRSQIGSRSEMFIKRCYPIITNNGHAIEFPRMYEKDIIKWLQTRTLKNSLKISDSAASVFVERAGSDLRHLASELEKCVIYLEKGDSITENTIENLISSNWEMFAFKILELLFERKTTASIEFLNYSLQANTYPLIIVATITSYLRKLLQIRYLFDMGYFKSVPRLYTVDFGMRLTSELKTIKTKYHNLFPEDGKNSIFSQTAWQTYRNMKQTERISTKNVEKCIKECEKVDLQLKGIEPKPGDDVLTLQILLGKLSEYIR